MNLSEFNNEFDILYNNIMSNQAPGLDAYEKSVFLTMGQEDIIRSYFNRWLNKIQEGFDDSSLRQIDFSILVTVKNLDVIKGAGNIDSRTSGVAKVDLPEDAMMFLNESLLVKRSNKDVYLQILPLAYTEYARLMSKPYKRPLKTQAWRLQSTNGNSSQADLIAGEGDSISKYSLRYVKKPLPIILEPLDGVSINGYTGAIISNNIYTPVAENATTGMPCELDPVIHREVLQRAVELAKAAYTGDLQMQIALSQASTTEKGIISQRQ